MSNSNPKEMLDAIETNQKIATINIDQFPYNERAGAELNKIQAQHNVATNRLLYHLWVKTESGACIVLEGSPEAQVKFAEKAKEIGNTINIDAFELYQGLCSGFWAASGGRGLVGYEEVAAVLRRLDRHYQSLGIHQYHSPGLGILFQRVFASEKEIAQEVKGIMRQIGSDDLNAKLLLGKVTEKALEAKCQENIVPVILMNAIPEEGKALAEKMYGSRSVTIKVPDEPTEKDVLTAFKTLKNTIKRKDK